MNSPKHRVDTCPYDQTKWGIIAPNGTVERTFSKSLLSKSEIEESFLPTTLLPAPSIYSRGLLREKAHIRQEADGVWRHYPPIWEPGSEGTTPLLTRTSITLRLAFFQWLDRTERHTDQA